MKARKKDLPFVKTIQTLRNTINEFSDRISEGVKRSNRRFLREVIYGILTSGSSVLSRIAETIRKEGITFHGVEKRLGYELGEMRNEDEIRRRANTVIKGKHFLEKTPIFALDLTDINKEGSHIFEYMDKVHDGSKGEIVDGYLSVIIEGIESKGEHLPLYMEMFSTKARGFKSINDEVRKGVEKVVEVFGKTGQWIMDRGFDGNIMMEYFVNEGLEFVIRGFRNRTVETEEGSVQLIKEVVNNLELPGRHPFYQYYILRKDGQKNRWIKKEKRIKFGYCQIKIAADEKPYTDRKTLNLIVIEGIGNKDERSYFYTNIPINNLTECLNVAKLYGKRWGCEEGIRFLKQALGIEDIRVQTYAAFRRMIFLAQISAMALWYALNHLQSKQKRIFAWLMNFAFSRKKRPCYIFYRIEETIRRLAATESLVMDFLGKL